MVAAGRGGVIVHVSSGETMRSAPMLSVYGAAKAAINHLTTSMAVELGPSGIRVLAVAPGTTRHRAHPRRDDARSTSTPSPRRRRCSVTARPRISPT